MRTRLTRGIRLTFLLFFFNISAYPQSYLRKPQGAFMDDERLPGQISLQYNEFSDLLGGAVWEEAFDRWTRSGFSSARQESLGRFTPYFSSPHQFLFSEDRHRYPLEVLWLKWNLFIGLCRRIQNIHQEHQRPLLNLQPAHLRVYMAEAAEDCLPVRWGFSIDTSNLQLADRFIPPGMPADFPAPLFSPPPDAHPLYAPVLVRREGIEQRETATLLVRSTERMRDSPPGEVRGIVQAQLVSEPLKASDYSLGDLFLITPNLSEEDGEPLRIWASKRASAERGVLLEGVTESVSPSVWEQFEKARQKVFSHSEVVIYKSLHIPCDLYSLGMILFQTLLVNDQHEMEGVHQTISKTAEQLGLISFLLEDQEKQFLSRRLRFYLRKEEEVLSKKAILHRQQDRENGCDAVSDDLWTEALLIGFRLIQNRSEVPLDQIGNLMERVTADAERLGGRIKLELFGSRERNREILEACDLIRKELSDVRNG